jgi:hypothetical protein
MFLGSPRQFHEPVFGCQRRKRKVRALDGRLQAFNQGKSQASARFAFKLVAAIEIAVQ